MSYIHVPTLRYPLSPNKIRAENPNTSFPRPFVPTDDYANVVSVEQPAHDSLTHAARELQPVQVNGVWTQQWEVVALPEEEITQRNDAQAAQVRAERNSKLAAADWTQLADSTADKAAWATYRQALRDITTQAGFPWTIDWPVQP
jgi:hypothetical protein